MRFFIGLIATTAIAALSVSQQANAWESCWNDAQNRVVAEIQPRVEAASGMCQPARIATEMYERLLEEARSCGVPQQGISELQTLVRQAQESEESAC